MDNGVSQTHTHTHTHTHILFLKATIWTSGKERSVLCVTEKTRMKLTVRVFHQQRQQQKSHNTKTHPPRERERAAESKSRKRSGRRDGERRALREELKGTERSSGDKTTPGMTGKKTSVPLRR